MNDVVSPRGNTIPAMSDQHIEKVRAAESFIRGLPQVMITTDHSLHAGVYIRTILIPKGVVLTGALIKCATNLIISGHVIVSIGEGRQREYKGYAVIQASANRKQAFVAKEDTYLTMFFATEAQSVEEAEDEFTDESELLMSRRADSINNVTITGE